MTSIILSSFKDREDKARETRSTLNDDCAFCSILRNELPAYKVYEDEHVLAFLDILPIRQGHTLLVPKEHHVKMYASGMNWLEKLAKTDSMARTDLPSIISAHMAGVLPRLCRAVCAATDQPDFNLVNNNGYAQVVPHVHWHIVPAPKLNQRTRQADPAETSLPIGLREIQLRNELDDDEAVQLANRIRDFLTRESQSRL